MLASGILAHALAPVFNVSVVEFGVAVEDMEKRVADVGRPAGTCHVGAGLGGTTALWHNALIEVEEDIFRGDWPFPKSELMPWCEAAYPLLGGVERCQVADLADATREKYQKLGLMP